MKLKNSIDFAKLLLVNQDNPHVLNSIHVEMSATYSYLLNEYRDLKLKLDFYCVDNKKIDSKKPLSDAHLERLFKKTEDGKRLHKLHYERLSFEKMMKSVSGASYVAQQEAKGKY